MFANKYQTFLHLREEEGTRGRIEIASIFNAYLREEGTRGRIEIASIFNAYLREGGKRGWIEIVTTIFNAY